MPLSGTPRVTANVEDGAEPFTAASHAFHFAIDVWKAGALNESLHAESSMAAAEPSRINAIIARSPHENHKEPSRWRQ